MRSVTDVTSEIQAETSGGKGLFMIYQFFVILGVKEEIKMLIFYKNIFLA